MINQQESFEDVRYEEQTDDINVVVVPEYIPSQSDPDSDLYFFIYNVRIYNESPYRMKLLSRHWIIRDGNQHEKQVYGRGVIGVQPEIEPGGMHEYTSGCHLVTPTGNMRGHFGFLNKDLGIETKVKIPLFFLRPAPGDIFSSQEQWLN